MFLGNNHWLAGFIQGDGSFQIQINYRATVKTKNAGYGSVMQISQKNDLLLQQIQNDFWRYIVYYYKPQDYYFYTSSGSIPNAERNLLNYLDHYQVIGSSFKIYQLWRQAHFYMRKRHLTELVQKSIVDFKASMSKLENELELQVK